MAAEKAGWGQPLPKGVARGIAVHFSFYTYVAEVAEVFVDSSGNMKIHRIVAAVDCRVPVNPDGIEAQIEGGIIYGLTAGMGGRISIDKGRVQEGNFDDYPLLRIGEVPKVEVHVVPSGDPPSGTGKPGLPPAMAAVANAIFAARGKPVRRLPIRAEDFVS